MFKMRREKEDSHYNSLRNLDFQDYITIYPNDFNNVALWKLVNKK